MPHTIGCTIALGIMCWKWLQSDGAISNQRAINHSIGSYLQVWATFIGSHLTRDPTASPVLTKWWNGELMLATNFGNLCQTVTKVGSQILATKFGFFSVPDCYGAQFILDTIKTYLHFIQFLNLESWKTSFVTTFFDRQAPVYPAESIPWLLMTWWHKEPGHQQARCWPNWKRKLPTQETPFTNKN